MKRPLPRKQRSPFVQGWLRAALLALLFPIAGAGAKVEYVIAISIDGGRGDYLKQFIDTAPAEFPNFTRLQALSACTFNARCDYLYSITIPDHLCMLTGRPVTFSGPSAIYQHGITSDSPLGTDTIHNSGLSANIYKASIFDLVHDRGLGTALYMGKTRLEICERSWNQTNGAVDATGIDNGRDKIDVAMIQEALGTNATPTMLAAFVATIQNTTLKNFSFFHIADTDYAGHTSGWVTTVGSTYRNVMKVADGWIGQILDSVQGNAALAGKVAIILTSDHGGGLPSTNHTDATNVVNYTIPFFLSAPGITGGTDIYQWLENRYNPGALRPDYASPKQPLRNGDVANLSAALLGLPSVPGSLMIPELKKPFSIDRNGDQFSVAWPVYLNGYTLESTNDLANPSWQAITSGVSELDGRNTYSFAYSQPGMRFFRLRKPGGEPTAPVGTASPSQKKKPKAAKYPRKPASSRSR